MVENRKKSLAGEKGYALTVFESPVIERIEVTIKTVIPAGSYFITDIILARVSGPLIDKIGGVPFGASGSPVFVHDKLIGAISYIFTDFKLVGITPVEAIRSLEFEPSTAIEKSALNNDKNNYKEKLITTDNSDRTKSLLPVVSCFTSGRAVQELKKHYNYAFSPAVSTNMQTKQTGVRIEQGSPVGVGLMTGDVRVGFIGTTTIFENHRVFSFGHPLFFSGPTNLPLTESVVYETARGMWPEKIADLGAIIGTVLQDRIAGIYGRTDVWPSVARLSYSAEDLDRRKTETINAQATRFLRNLPFLSFMAALELFDRAMNRIGQGSAKWKLVIHVENIPAPIIVRREAFSAFDIAYEVALSVLEITESIIAQGLLINEIKLTSTVESRKTVQSPSYILNSPIKLPDKSGRTQPRVVYKSSQASKVNSNSSGSSPFAGNV